MRTLIIPALVVAFTVYCLVDVLRSAESDIRGLPKLPWVFVVLLFPLVGGAAWFIAGRPRGTRPPGTDRVARPRPRVLGPDDDPDFLRTIHRPSPAPPASEPPSSGPPSSGPPSSGPPSSGPPSSDRPRQGSGGADDEAGAHRAEASEDGAAGREGRDEPNGTDGRDDRRP